MLISIAISIVLVLYTICIIIASILSKKARLWVKGRWGQFDKLKKTFKDNERPIWVHCASLGEYEQARPLIEKIKQDYPDISILVTFYSPSGYENRKNDPLPDHIFYLPQDTKNNSRRFLSIVQPRMAIFVKYEFWFNYIDQLDKRNIPFFYVCSIFRPNQYFFKIYGKWFAKQLRKCSFFFVQNEESKRLLGQIGIHQVEVCGDTRFDRVREIARQPYELDFVTQFKQNSKLIVAGSTWGPDEILLARLLHRIKGYKLIVAPHEISRKEEVLRFFAPYKTVCFSELDTLSTVGSEGGDSILGNNDVLVLDTIGLLSKVYKYGDVAYVGGAFRTGLHNILEAAVFGIPVFFGPKYSKFNEAVILVQEKGAFSIKNSREMAEIIHQFESDPQYYEQTCNICRGYVEANAGACDKICNYIFEQHNSSIINN